MLNSLLPRREPLTRAHVSLTLARIATLDRLGAQLELLALIEALDANRGLELDGSGSQAISAARQRLGL